MVMESIDSLMVTKFSDMVHVRSQQMQARLRPYAQTVDVKPGDVAAYDGLGTVEARLVTGRYSPSTFDDIEHNRRQLSRQEFVITLPIDEYDLEGMLLNPQGKYVDAAVMAMERNYDRVAYGAMFATINTGRNFSTPLSFASDGGLTVNATGGLTLAKLLAADQNFIDGEVGNDLPIRKCMGISGEENTTMEQIDQLINNRYRVADAGSRLDEGLNRKQMVFDILPFGNNVTIPVLTVASGVRTCFVMATGGICVGMWRQWQVTLKDRPDLINTKQVQITGVIGAVRTEGKLVQQFTTTV
jgi:hypothetical protein